MSFSITFAVMPYVPFSVKNATAEELAVPLFFSHVACKQMTRPDLVCGPPVAHLSFKTAIFKCDYQLFLQTVQ
jgi:hypothetical protein